MCVINDEITEEHDRVSNIYFEAIFPSINKIFHQRMIDFVDKLDSNDQKYQTNRTVIDGNYNGKLLFTMRGLLSFGTDNK